MSQVAKKKNFNSHLVVVHQNYENNWHLIEGLSLRLLKKKLKKEETEINYQFLFISPELTTQETNCCLTQSLLFILLIIYYLLWKLNSFLLGSLSTKCEGLFLLFSPWTQDLSFSCILTCSFMCPPVKLKHIVSKWKWISSVPYKAHLSTVGWKCLPLKLVSNKPMKRERIILPRWDTFTYLRQNSN